MKTIYRLLALVVAAAGARGSLAAQELGLPRPAGHVLLLPGDRGLEGDIEKVGEQYRVRRGTSEVWLPADKVVRLCTDWEDAYAFLKTRANLGDPQERLRLAHWCQLNNLPDKALGEAKVALEMRPRHEETRHLVAMLSRSVTTPPSPSAKTPAADGVKMRVAPPPSDISSDSFAQFATRVQPILMNTCVSCHSGGRGGAFQLVRTEGGQRALTQANLAAVLAQVRVDRPALSPLLIKAVSPHGNASNSPIKDRKTIPFRALQEWIESLLANNPHLKYREAEATTSAPRKAAEPDAFAQMQAPVPVTLRPFSRPETTSQEPQRTPSSDPFDPAAFNGPQQTPRVPRELTPVANAPGSPNPGMASRQR
jgi:hypothetical protein